MILSYRKTFEGSSTPTEFEPKIKSGKKVHSIRADEKNRWKVGMKIQQANGVRTKHYNCFQEDTCTAIQTIEVLHPTCYFNDSIIKVDGRKLSLDESVELAHNDGFDCLVAFLMWFDSDFKGKIIHWTDKRY